MADLAGDVDVGEEVHLDLLLAVAFAGLAAPALDVEREAAGLVAVGPRLGQAGEQIPHQIKSLGIGRGIGARRATDRLLIDGDDLVELVEAVDAFVDAYR